MCVILGVIFHLYCGKLKHNVSAAVSSGLPQVSLVYLGKEMIQPEKSFLKFVDQTKLYFQVYIFFKMYNFREHEAPVVFVERGRGAIILEDGSQGVLASHIRRPIHTIQTRRSKTMKILYK